MSRLTPRSSLRRLMTAVAISLMAAATFAVTSASAYVESNYCNPRASASTCTVPGGYHTYQEVETLLDYGPRSQVCAKARTEAGGTRTGSGNGCDGNTAQRYSCFTTPTPYSQAYGYWAGTGSSNGVSVWGRTLSSLSGCAGVVS